MAGRAPFLANAVQRTPPARPADRGRVRVASFWGERWSVVPRSAAAGAGSAPQPFRATRAPRLPVPDGRAIGVGPPGRFRRSRRVEQRQHLHCRACRRSAGPRRGRRRLDRPAPPGPLPGEKGLALPRALHHHPTADRPPGMHGRRHRLDRGRRAIRSGGDAGASVPASSARPSGPAPAFFFSGPRQTPASAHAADQSGSAGRAGSGGEGGDVFAMSGGHGALGLAGRRGKAARA